MNYKSILLPYKSILLPLSVAGLLTATTSVQAETVFITDNSAKNLASNESDASIGTTTLDGGGTENNGLDLDADGDSTVLSLSQDDQNAGFGDITFNTVAVTDNLFMSTDSMGNGNDLWGNGQNWTFTLDQTISFDALDFDVGGDEDAYSLRSAAWKDDADASGTGWSFTSDGTIGIFSLTSGQIYDFTSAGVSNVAAGTEIGFGAFGGANGGDALNSFTITPQVIPEPSAFALLAGMFGLTWVMLRRRS